MKPHRTDIPDRHLLARDVRQCAGKVKFLDEASAAKSAARTAAAFPDRFGPAGEFFMNHYQCPTCRFWHVGRKRRRTNP